MEHWGPRKAALGAGPLGVERICARAGGAHPEFSCWLPAAGSLPSHREMLGVHLPSTGLSKKRNSK